MKDSARLLMNLEKQGKNQRQKRRKYQAEQKRQCHDFRRITFTRDEKLCIASKQIKKRLCYCQNKQSSNRDGVLEDVP